MENQYLPTKTNLLKIKASIKLSKQGRELLERKRIILLREKEKYIEQVEDLREEMGNLFKGAFSLFKQANVDMGINLISDISEEIPKEKSISIKYKTIMGVEIPSIIFRKNEKKENLNFGFYNTTISFDKAVIKFNEIKEKLIMLTELENTIKRLDIAITKVRTRSNALENIIIPRDEKVAKKIQETLEEKDREDFSRLKLIKRKLGNY